MGINLKWLSEAIQGKKFKKGSMNLINAHAGSGKTSFVFGKLLENYKDYGIDKLRLNKIIYVCDTSSLCYRILINKSDVCKKYETGDLDNIIDGNETKIIVMTYANLGLLLQNEYNKFKLLNADMFILDEIHNLPRYCNRYDSKNEGVYGNVIKSLNEISRKCWCIGLSATFDDDIAYRFNEKGIFFNKIFNCEEEKMLRSYNLKPIYTNYVFNILKKYVLLKDKCFKDNIVDNKIVKKERLLIYTNTIKQADKYKQYFLKNGINAEWLCSINATEEDEEGNKILRMNSRQLEIRETLLDTGVVDNQLGIDVLIINGAYETGIDIYNEEIQHVIIDNKNEITQIQSRNRVRHDIKELYTTCKYEEIEDGEFIVPILDKYKKFIDVKADVYIPNLAEYLDDKYVGIKLTTELKNEMIDKYSVKKCTKEDNEFTFASLKEDIEKLRYKVYTTIKYGTWIFKIDDLIKYMKNNNIEKYSDDLLEEYRKFVCDEVENVNDNKELLYYLDGLVGVRLYKDDRENLAEKLNVRKNGKLLKSLNAISAGLEVDNIPYEIQIKDTDWDRNLEDGSKNSNYGKSFFIISEKCI